MAYKTTNTRSNFLSTVPKLGIRLTHIDCNEACVGQTGRSMNIRYKENIRNIKCRKEELAFAAHILNSRHQCCRMENVIDVIEYAKRGN